MVETVPLLTAMAMQARRDIARPDLRALSWACEMLCEDRQCATGKVARQHGNIPRLACAERLARGDARRFLAWLTDITEHLVEEE